MLRMSVVLVLDAADPEEFFRCVECAAGCIPYRICMLRPCLLSGVLVPIVM